MARYVLFLPDWGREVGTNSGVGVIFPTASDHIGGSDGNKDTLATFLAGKGDAIGANGDCDNTPADAAKADHANDLI